MMTQDLNRLRYSISNWSQATKCLSNNSKELRISVANYIHNTDFEGQIISVVHTRYGTMFATITNGRGYLVSTTDEEGHELPFLTTEAVLKQLEKFGFDISYEEEPNLSGEQLTFLTNLYDLGYDAITRVRVQYAKVSRNVVIAYNSAKGVDYLKFNTIVPKAKFDESLESGAIVNVAKMNPDLEWDWLTYTCQIEDLLDDNSIVHHVTERSPEPPMVDVPESENAEFVPASYEEPSFAPSLDPSTFHVYGAVEIIGDDNEVSNETSY